MSFPSYPAYSPTNLFWARQIPSCWNVVRVKDVCSFSTGWTPPTGDSSSYEGENLWANISDLGKRTIFDTAKRISDQAVAKAGISIVQKGSLLFSFKLSIGHVSFAGREMFTNEAIASFGPCSSLDLRFAYYAFPLFLIQNASENIYGAKLLNQELINSARLILPPRVEQGIIADFLDREIAKIDALIEEQRQLIELLKEKRQAVISHAVTKGLDPSVRMKDSGFEWLGDIPSTWQAGFLTRISDRIVVGIAEAAVHAYSPLGIPILRSTNVRAGQITGEILYVTPEFAAERGSKLINAGDLITVRTGHAGVTAVIPESLDGCQCFTMLITSLCEGQNPHFYCYWLNSAVAAHYFSTEAWGSAQPNISVPILKTCPTPIPPIQEQAAIVRFLDSETAKIDALISEAEAVTILLRERRCAIIFAAVTGKIDVRSLTKTEAA